MYHHQQHIWTIYSVMGSIPSNPVMTRDLDSVCDCS